MGFRIKRTKSHYIVRRSLIDYEYRMRLRAKGWCYSIAYLFISSGTKKAAKPKLE